MIWEESSGKSLKFIENFDTIPYFDKLNLNRRMCIMLCNTYGVRSRLLRLITPQPRTNRSFVINSWVASSEAKFWGDVLKQPAFHSVRN